MALVFSPASIGNLSFRVGEVVDVQLPVAQGAIGTVTYALSPELPTGLAFDTATGRITGQSTQIADDVLYTYSARDAGRATGDRLVDSGGDTLVDSNGDTLTNSINEISEQFFLGVAAPEIVIAPVRFVGGIETQHYQVGEMVAVRLPEAESAAGIASYEISPVLGFGLTFDSDPAVRTIQGLPDEVVNGLRFRYTATTTQGATVSLEFLLYIAADPYVIDNEGFVSILPPNATAWEKGVEQVLRESFLPIDANSHRRLRIIDAWNPAKAPVETLPYLGQNLSVLVDGQIGETEQRALIQQSYAIHKIEGTVGSLLRVIEALGFPGATILEGVADTDGTRHWTHYSVSINENVTISVGRALLRVIQDTQPVRCKLIAIDVTAAGQTWDGTIDFDGMHTFGSIVDSGLV